jgi:signal transduction histidine kinase
MRVSLKNADVRGIFSGGSRTRASIILPFVIISIALAALAWRSYQLSVRMESALNSFAVHYLVYAAEVTARRTDVAAGNERFVAHEQLQLLERSVAPDFDALQGWLDKHPWVVSAIYVPDDEPANSIYVTEMPGDKPRPVDRQTYDFFTSGGSVRYTYDAQRLLEHASRLVERQSLHPETAFPQAAELGEHSSIRVVPAASASGVRESDTGYSIAVTLAPPLQNYAVEASVDTRSASAGWRNHRIVSLLFGALAIFVVAAGAQLAIHGLRKEAEATKLRAALVANVSHELRTPLSMIRLGAETLKRSTRLRPEDRTALEDSILREVVHLSHLVENVLDVARLQRSSNPFAFQPLDPAELVRSVVETYGSWVRSKGFELELDLDEEVEEQMWDREAVSRALLNLIDNAIKYSGDDRRLRVFLQREAEAVALGVEDHGIGIEPADLQRIFEPYYRASFSDTQTRRGAGLGLTLVQQIVKSHGGRIEVDSTPGQGSTFKLLFPARSESSRAGERSGVLKPSEAS